MPVWANISPNPIPISVSAPMRPALSTANRPIISARRKPFPKVRAGRFQRPVRKAQETGSTRLKSDVPYRATGELFPPPLLLRGLWNTTAGDRDCLQPLDEPPASRPRRRLGLPHRGHGKRQTVRRHILDGQDRKASLLQIVPHDMLRHTAPTEAIEQEVMLREEVGEAPCGRRHDTKLAPRPKDPTDR